MHDGCKGLPGMADLKKADEKKWTEVCSRMRQDGPFVEAGENDNLIVQRLEADANSVGIFGYSFLYENSDKLKDVKINGVAATRKRSQMARTLLPVRCSSTSRTLTVTSSPA